MSTLQPHGRKDSCRHKQFFLICLSHDSLVNYYKTNFQLMQHHHYSLTEIDMMMPWEREIYLSMLIDHIKEENERQEEQNRQMSRR
jgi:hypothetical protein